MVLPFNTEWICWWIHKKDLERSQHLQVTLKACFCGEKLKKGWLDYRFCFSWFQYLHFYTNAISICLGRLHRWGYLDNSLLCDGARAALAGVQTLFHRETAAMRFQPLHKQVVDSSKVVIAFVLERLWQERQEFFEEQYRQGMRTLEMSHFYQYGLKIFWNALLWGNHICNSEDNLFLERKTINDKKHY